jgi:soluble lytic murein transglycosylase-like protein
MHKVLVALCSASFLFTAVTAVAYEERLQAYEERCAPYKPMILQELQEAQLPAELYYLALAESGCRTTVVSSAGAVGLFQLLPSTYLHYTEEPHLGLDGLRHPEYNTKAAVRYLSSLYRRFDQDLGWTIAAYNCGGTNLRRAVGYTPGMSLQAVRSVYPAAYALATYTLALAQTGRKLEQVADAEPALPQEEEE